jgi:hypothetical protein
MTSEHDKPLARKAAAMMLGGGCVAKTGTPEGQNTHLANGRTRGKAYLPSIVSRGPTGQGNGGKQFPRQSVCKLEKTVLKHFPQ